MSFWSQAPAWIQAIGSIVALAIAIYIPTKIEANNRKSRENVTALRLLFFLQKYETAFSFYCDDISKSDGETIEEVERNRRAYELLQDCLDINLDTSKALIELEYLLSSIESVSEPIVRLVILLKEFENLGQQAAIQSAHGSSGFARYVTFPEQISKAKEIASFMKQLTSDLEASLSKKNISKKECS